MRGPRRAGFAESRGRQLPDSPRIPADYLCSRRTRSCQRSLATQTTSTQGPTAAGGEASTALRPFQPFPEPSAPQFASCRRPWARSAKLLLLCLGTGVRGQSRAPAPPRFLAAAPLTPGGSLPAVPAHLKPHLKAPARRRGAAAAPRLSPPPLETPRPRATPTPGSRSASLSCGALRAPCRAATAARPRPRPHASRRPAAARHLPSTSTRRRARERRRRVARGRRHRPNRRSRAHAAVVDAPRASQ